MHIMVTVINMDNVVEESHLDNPKDLQSFELLSYMINLEVHAFVVLETSLNSFLN
jgi:hypothetical protein